MASRTDSPTSQIEQENPEYQRRFEEVDLPFDVIDEDHVTGEELREALVEQLSRLDFYVVSGLDPVSGDYRVRAFTDESGQSNYIGFNGNRSEDYSYLRVELGATDRSEFEELYGDLDALEEDLGRHFQQQPAGGNSSCTSSVYATY